MSLTLREKAEYLLKLGWYVRFFRLLLKQDKICGNDKMFIEKLYDQVEMKL